MKIGTKRGDSAAVLEAPEDGFASDGPYERPSSRRAPRVGDQLGDRRADGPDGDLDPLERPAFSRRRVSAKPAPGLRLPLPGLPRSTAGRIGAAAALLAALGIMAGAVLAGRQYLLESPRFLLAGSEAIEVLGTHELTRAQALSVFSADLDRNIFHLSLAERKADLERLPWVEHATVMRLLPNRLRVAIVERTPVAYVRQGTQIGLVDANGVLLDMPADAAGNPQYSFPVLTGIDASDPLSTRKARMQIYTRFLNAMSAGGEQVLDSLSEVDVTDPEDVKAVIARDNADILVHFGDQDFLERYRIFDEHLAEWKQAYPKLVSADLRYDNQIVLDSGLATTADAAAPAAGPAAAPATPMPGAPAPTPAATPAKAPPARPLHSAGAARVAHPAARAAHPAARAPVPARPHPAPKAIAGGPVQ